MKKIIHTLFAASFTLFALSSCVIDSQLLSDPYGIVQVEIAESVGAVTRANDQTMESIRMIVFSDPATNPTVEFNEMFSDFVIIPATTPEKTPKVRFNLRILRKDGATEADKLLIVAVINEPQDSGQPGSIQDVLAKTDVTFAELAALKLPLSKFVTDDHQALATDKTIPMTGVLMTNYTKLLSERELSSAEPLELVAHRAIARVDVYLKGATNSQGVTLDPDLTMTVGSTIKLDNTYDKTNLIYHTWDSANTIGEMQSVGSGNLFPKTWTAYTSGLVSSFSTTTPVCSFYTPERHCESDPLELNVTIKTTEGTTRSGTLKITQAYGPEDTEREHPITVNDILRNHVYRVMVSITANGITGEILDWVPQPIETKF